MAGAVPLVAVQVHNHQVFRLHHPFAQGCWGTEHQIMAQAHGNVSIRAGYKSAPVKHPANTADFLADSDLILQRHYSSPYVPARELYRTLSRNRRGSFNQYNLRSA